MHASLGITPFQALYGHLPPEFGITQPTDCSAPDLASWLQERDVMRNLLQHHLLRAQRRMKHQADKHRVERSFEIGDMVFLKLQPYIQSSVASRPHQKLAFRYYGPYKVLQRVGSVAYKLDLPAHAKIHPVVHVSQLKKVVRPATEVSHELPPDLNLRQSLSVPELVLSRKHVRKGAVLRPFVHIQWRGLLPHLATWEDEHLLRLQFPAAPAWGQAGSQEGEIVT